VIITGHLYLNVKNAIELLTTLCSLPNQKINNKKKEEDPNSVLSPDASRMFPMS
jgi:hypothetical protein